jgi:retron-type reverse transcriptase
VNGKATGVDQTTKEEYGAKLGENLEDLLRRMKSFSYRPQPVRRTYIPKAGSDKLRPLGILAYEDKCALPETVDRERWRKTNETAGDGEKQRIT